MLKMYTFSIQDDGPTSGIIIPKSSEMIRQRLKHAAVPQGTPVADGNVTYDEESSKIASFSVFLVFLFIFYC
jgi:hypothetical protein